MQVKRKALMVIYLLVGVTGLIGTWSNNIAYLGEGRSFLAVNQLFWQETLTSPASRSITIDILCLALPVLVWMFLEARRLGMKGIWLYYLACIFIAAGAAIPFFLAHREKSLDDTSADSYTLAIADVIGLLLLGSAIGGYIWLAVGR